jgi:PhzF family phenazine biosynthesis protein
MADAGRDLEYYYVNAFSKHPRGGNPAAVMPLRHFLSDEDMLAIARDHGLSETAFFVANADPAGGGFALRWFTPSAEVPLCGHATLASAWVILNRLEPQRRDVVFATQSGPLTVTRDTAPHGQRLVLDLPMRPVLPLDDATDRSRLEDALGARVSELWRTPLGNGEDNALVVLADAEAVASLRPDLAKLRALSWHGCIVTAKGERGVDFVSRFFAPRVGVDEDPVTGSAHASLVPFWAKRTGRSEFFAQQGAPRRPRPGVELGMGAGPYDWCGELGCALSGERVLLKGDAALTRTGVLHAW